MLRDILKSVFIGSSVALYIIGYGTVVLFIVMFADSLDYSKLVLMGFLITHAIGSQYRGLK